MPSLLFSAGSIFLFSNDRDDALLPTIPRSIFICRLFVRPYCLKYVAARWLQKSVRFLPIVRFFRIRYGAINVGADICWGSNQFPGGRLG
jgi:hypothetical protein